MMKKLLLYVILLLLISSCSENKKSIDFSKLINWKELQYDSGLSRLVHKAYEHRHDSLFPELCKALNDSILTDSNLLWLRTTTSQVLFDTLIAVNWSFTKVPKSVIPGCGLGLDFTICIQDSNNILIEYEKKKSSDIFELGSDFFFNPSSPDYKRRTKGDSIQYFGKVDLSRAFISLQTNLIGKRGLSIGEWKLFFECLHQSIRIFDVRQEKLAKQKWGKSYAVISPEKQAGVLNYVSPSIFLIFDTKCYTIEELTPQPIEHEDSILLKF